MEDVAVGFRLLSPLGERLGEGAIQEIVFDPLCATGWMVDSLDRLHG
jgi:hypothetical protein